MTPQTDMYNDDFSEEEERVLKSIKLNRIILPILLGLGVVAYLLHKSWDAEAVSSIVWDGHTFFWIGIAIGLMVFRHLAYAARLRVMSDGFFSWKKCIQLIFIWEFSSSVSPTSVGGSAVALFVLSQEKLGAARTTALVLYAIVVDTIFFLTAIPFMLLLFGGGIVPRLDGMAFGSWTFYVTFGIMVVYGTLLFYGLFIQPRHFKSLLMWLTRWNYLRRFRSKAEQLGEDIIIAAKEVKHRKASFHFATYITTALAWSIRFLILNCLIIAFNSAGTIALDFWSQGELYARLQSFFVILLLLPSPGGAGFAEAVFGEFLVNFNYISQGKAVIVAFIWRLISYYPYLLAGAIVIPWWLRGILNQKRKQKLSKKA